MKVATKLKLRGKDEYVELLAKELWISSCWRGEQRVHEISLTVPPVSDSDDENARPITKFLMTKEEALSIGKSLIQCAEMEVPK